MENNWQHTHDYIPGDGDLGQPECRHCGLLKSTITAISADRLESNNEYEVIMSKSMFDQELEKAREEVADALNKQAELEISEARKRGRREGQMENTNASDPLPRQEERTRILGIIKTLERLPNPMVPPSYDEGWNAALEALKDKLQ